MIPKWVPVFGQDHAQTEKREARERSGCSDEAETRAAPTLSETSAVKNATSDIRIAAADFAVNVSYKSSKICPRDLRLISEVRHGSATSTFPFGPREVGTRP